MGCTVVAVSLGGGHGCGCGIKLSVLENNTVRGFVFKSLIGKFARADAH